MVLSESSSDWNNEILCIVFSLSMTQQLKEVFVIKIQKRTWIRTSLALAKDIIRHRLSFTSVQKIDENRNNCFPSCKQLGSSGDEMKNQTKTEVQLFIG